MNQFKMNRRVALLLGVCAAPIGAAPGAWACSDGSCKLTATVRANAQMAPAPATNGALAPLDAPVVPTNAGLAPMDRVFFIRAAEGNMAEVMLGQLAMQKSRNDEVKRLAAMIVREHSNAQTQLMALATRKGVALPTMLSPTHLAVQERLRKAGRNDFDKMYLANQTDDHENTIALFANQISMGSDPDAKTLANAQLPRIVGHTTMIYGLARRVGAPGSELRPPTPPAPPGVVAEMPEMSAAMPMR